MVHHSLPGGGSRTHDPDFSRHSLDLMMAGFRWCRMDNPEQPLTVGAWSTPPSGSGDEPYQTDIDKAALDLSDIVTFHAYRDVTHVRRYLRHLGGLGRPMLCTEWMARAVGSRISDQLGLFKAHRVGCFQWGLVQGRTQTTLPWPADLVEAHGGHADRSIWFHDLLDEHGNPYDQQELDKVVACVGHR